MFLAGHPQIPLFSVSIVVFYLLFAVILDTGSGHRWKILLGAGVMFVWAFGCGMILFNLIKYSIGLRASAEDELKGLDISEHGNEAYYGFQLFTTQ